MVIFILNSISLNMLVKVNFVTDQTNLQQNKEKLIVGKLQPIEVLPVK